MGASRPLTPSQLAARCHVMSHGSLQTRVFGSSRATRGLCQRCECMSKTLRHMRFCIEATALMDGHGCVLETMSTGRAGLVETMRVGRVPRPPIYAAGQGKPHTSSVSRRRHGHFLPQLWGSAEDASLWVSSTASVVCRRVPPRNCIVWCWRVLK